MSDDDKLITGRGPGTSPTGVLTRHPVEILRARRHLVLEVLDVLRGSSKPIEIHADDGLPPYRTLIDTGTRTVLVPYMLPGIPGIGQREFRATGRRSDTGAEVWGPAR